MIFARWLSMVAAIDFVFLVNVAPEKAVVGVGSSSSSSSSNNSNSVVVMIIVFLTTFVITLITARILVLVVNYRVNRAQSLVEDGIQRQRQEWECCPFFVFQRSKGKAKEIFFLILSYHQRTSVVNGVWI